MTPYQRLKDWLRIANVTQAELARRCEYDRHNFHRVLNGTMTPTLKLAAAIERETGGAIPAIDWVAREAA